MRPIEKGGDNAEIAAASAKSPKEVFFFFAAGRQHLAVGRHHLAGQKIVASETVFAHEPDPRRRQASALPARVRETTPSGTARPNRRVSRSTSPALLRPAPALCAALDRRTRSAWRRGRSQFRCHRAPARRHSPDRRPGSRRSRSVGASKFDRVDDIRDPRTSDDHAGTLLDARVPDLSSGFVVGVRRKDHVSGHFPLENSRSRRCRCSRRCGSLVRSLSFHPPMPHTPSTLPTRSNRAFCETTQVLTITTATTNEHNNSMDGVKSVPAHARTQ